MPRLIRIRSTAPTEGGCDACVFFSRPSAACDRPDDGRRCPLPMRWAYGPGRADRRRSDPITHIYVEELHET